MKATTRWIVVLTGIGSLMAALDTLVMSTALSTIRADLGASIEQLEWTVNAYNLSFAVLLITGAALGDRFGRRRLFAAGLGLFAVASAACALAPSVGWLIAARAVQGAGSALLMPLGLALLSAAFPPEKRGAAIGIFSGITGLAVASGPLVGGAVIQGISWEWIFWINVPIGVIAVPLVLTKMKESFGPDTALDLTGLGLITAAALGIVWGLVRGNSAGWDSVEVIATIAVGVLLVAAFVAWERRAPAPMLPLELFRSRPFSAGNAAIFFTFAALFGAVFFAAQLMQTGLGYDAWGAGLRLLPWTGTFMTIAPIAGAMADRIGERPLMVSGLVLQSVGMAWLALVAEPGVAYGSLLWPLLVAGVGVSLAIPAAQNSVLGSSAMDAIGKAAGVNSMMRELGGVFGIAVAVAVFAGAGSYVSADAFFDGFGPAFGVIAGLSALGAMASMALPGRRSTAAFDAVRPIPAFEADGGA
ncbi:MAG TPA: DHA2 family efflux MFS transporter permease subunit [Thermoleophilaceae bacterium]|jgi:EmrB/QacA subfamily drug resistance transporter